MTLVVALLQVTSFCVQRIEKALYIMNVPGRLCLLQHTEV
jgi:hypothetical protein